ncbi:Ribose-phosphate pyrophosphokinase 3 [Hibiscus syriacus]|uniref:Ribose-phosphate pyrophosphokinase 3 n=1 Tax=Hibiscus syriacus TaxID=106335 RepID=A0A6A3B8P7_HIBSY|nr:Ribose-phosphate pyrophosphokinase 3 [Hibiscus syriacus]
MAATSHPLPSSFLSRRKFLSNLTSFKHFRFPYATRNAVVFNVRSRALRINLRIGVWTFSPDPNRTKALAERVAAESDTIELRNIKWRTFEDGFPNLFIPNAQGIRVIGHLCIAETVHFLLHASSPVFPTGTSERMEDEGDVATAFTLARILSNIPTSRGGPTSLVTFDIHALQERFYFGDNILPYFESGIPLLMIGFNSSLTLTKYPLHFRMMEGEAAGRHVVIVDDLVQSGGTLIECQKALAANGATKISAYVTHGISLTGHGNDLNMIMEGTPRMG